MQPEGTGTGRIPTIIDRLATALTRAEAQIAVLESDLTNNQAALSGLLANDVRSSEELAQLQKIIRSFHRWLPGGCGCTVCGEVERSQQELRGLF